MSEFAMWVFLGIATVLALAATRVNPTSWRPRRVRLVIIALVIIGAAALMELGLSQSHGVGASGVAAGAPAAAGS